MASHPYLIYYVLHFICCAVSRHVYNFHFSCVSHLSLIFFYFTQTCFPVVTCIPRPCKHSPNSMPLYPSTENIYFSHILLIYYLFFPPNPSSTYPSTCLPTLFLQTFKLNLKNYTPVTPILRAYPPTHKLLALTPVLQKNLPPAPLSSRSR